MQELSLLFIDGPSFLATCRRSEIDCDFKKIRDHFRKTYNVNRCLYFIAEEEDKTNFSKIRPFLDWLETNGYGVITKPLHVRETDDETIRTNSNVSVLLACSVLKAAFGPAPITHVIIASGHSDLIPLVQILKDIGIKVSILTNTKMDIPILSAGLRKAADELIEIIPIRHLIEKENPKLTPKAAE